MLVDPLDAADAFLNRPLGGLVLSLAASVFSSGLWFLDKHFMRERFRDSDHYARRSKRLQRIRANEAIAIHGCLKSLWVGAGLFAIIYLGRALLLK